MSLKQSSGGVQKKKNVSGRHGHAQSAAGTKITRQTVRNLQLQQQVQTVQQVHAAAQQRQQQLQKAKQQLQQAQQQVQAGAQQLQQSIFPPAATSSLATGL